MAEFKEIFAFCSSWRRRVYCFALQVVFIWKVDAEVEEGFCESDALDDQGDSEECGPRAIQADDKNGIEYADWCNTVESIYCSADKEVIQAAVADHDGLTVEFRVCEVSMVKMDMSEVE